MTAWHPESDDPYHEDAAQEALGGRPYRPTPNEARALARAGFANPATVARQAAIDEIDSTHFLSGTGGGNHDGPGHAAARRAVRAATVGGLMDQGLSLPELTATMRARQERGDES